MAFIRGGFLQYTALSFYLLLGAACALFPSEDEDSTSNTTLIYAGTTSGFNVTFDGGTSWTTRTKTEGLPSTNIRALFRGGSIVYVGTALGLSVTDDNGESYTTYTSTIHGLGSDTINGIYVTSAKKIYAATNYGLSIQNSSGSFDNYDVTDGLPSSIVNCVLVDGDTIWAGTNAGLVYSTNSGTSWTTRHTGDGLPNNIIEGVAKLGTAIWVATPAGLAKTTDNGASWSTRTTDNGLGSDNIRKIFISDDSLIWAATDAGLSVSEDLGDNFTTRSSIENGLATEDTYSVYVNNLNVYVGTSEGLSISTDGGETFTTKTIGDGLASNHVQAVVE